MIKHIKVVQMQEAKTWQGLQINFTSRPGKLGAARVSVLTFSGPSSGI